MTGQPTALTPRILDAYREASQAAGSPFSDELLPGLSDEEITALTSTLGIEPSDEVRTLWRWGVVPEKPQQDGAWEINNVFALFPPAHAISATERERSEDWTGNVPGWLAIGGGDGGVVSIDCHASQEAGTVWFCDVERNPELMGPSLGALFRHWTELIHSGELEIRHGRWGANIGEPSTFLR